MAAPQRQALDYDAASLITVSLGPQTSLSKPLKITRLVFTLVTTRESVGKVIVSSLTDPLMFQNLSNKNPTINRPS